jgi:peptidoglycan-associated lipoprotein
MLGAGIVALTAACASKPEPTPAPVASAPVTAPRSAPTAPAPTPTQGAVPGSRADFESAASSRVFFDYDQYDVDSGDRGTLTSQATWLKKYPGVRVQIEGHADERGTREYNIALGARRADAVSNFLISQGVDASRVSTISYGKDRPFNTGHDEASWAQNRNAYTNIVSGTIS